MHGIVRRSSSFNTGRIQHLYRDPSAHREGSMHLHYGDMIDGACMVKILTQARPDEVYNLAAQSHVKVSFEMAEYTAEVAGMGALRILDAIKTCGMEKTVRFYQVRRVRVVLLRAIPLSLVVHSYYCCYGAVAPVFIQYYFSINHYFLFLYIGLHL